MSVSTYSTKVAKRRISQITTPSLRWFSEAEGLGEQDHPIDDGANRGGLVKTIKIGDFPQITRNKKLIS